jgi:hypothetical protein
MEIDENIRKSMKIYENVLKSTRIHDIHAHVWNVFVLTQKMAYILYSKHIDASHICPPKTNILFKQRT